MNKIGKLLDSVIQQEEELLDGKRFFAPVLPDAKVQTKIDGLVYTFVVSNRTKFVGYGILKPTTIHNARVMKEADQEQVANYLRIFNQRALILLERIDEYSFSALDSNIKRGSVAVLRTVSLCESICEQFDVVNCALVDKTYLYVASSFQSDALLADYLRAQFEKNTKPERLKFTGLTEAHRVGYTLCWQARERSRKLTKEECVEKALKFGGGVLRRFVDRGATASVEWEMDGSVYNTTIKMDNTMEVLASGVCLSGKDKDFDLATLPFVMKERSRKERDDYDPDDD